MPKFVAVVGGDHSENKAVIQKLVSVLKSRGHHVAMIKEMKSIEALGIPEGSGETMEFRAASEEIVVASPLAQTAMFIKKKLCLNELVPFLDEMDYVLLEGFDKEKVFAKIIVAKTALEAASFSDGLAIAISGSVAETKDQTQVSAFEIPLFNIECQAEELANVVEEKAFVMLPNLKNCAFCHPVGECGYVTCYENAKAIVSGKSKTKGCPLTVKEKFIIEVNGVKVPLKDFPQMILQNMILGMLSSLHGTDDVKTVKIEIEKE
ncbi:MAG: molybdopterin-guanine dinucleotide biosynthesis protein MobB [Candidatus Bathyarchaeota archaeon]|nr:molybdopterin-guanine dinucleotide biosynthesis protein MobB [Candidatus Bathyarchaeota archaeon]